nr:MAG TPA: alpha-aminoadipate carrier protein [Caudoviricetes sp.]
MIEFRCPHCKLWNKPITADMGDKTIKCNSCGSYIHYKFRTSEFEIVKRPGRTSSSGLILY